MKRQKTGALLWGLAVLALSACPTTGGGAPTETGGPSGRYSGGTETAGTGGTVNSRQFPAGNPADSGPPAEETAASLTEAIRRSCGELLRDIPGPASVAVISVASGDPDEGEFAVEELVFFLVNSKKYSVVDRRSLDIIRAEQNFQLSGEVDDDTAVSIGHLIGAAIVITGTIVPYDSAKYLRLKALDVETGQIRAMSSRRFAAF
ncbi:MAG: CsgG/HfaB family protein [Treponema sp.]|jgi:hypothetical protein|nr:CsgG/HfaB family protein [Treponema sp.]